ncbi:dynamin family protein [Profundibacter sp.]
MNAPSREEIVRSVTPEKMERLSRWAGRKPVIALMGEFSSGKSTLLNMLVGQSILPTQVTATRLPPVWLRHGDETPFWVDRNGDRHDVSIDDLASVPIREARFIRIYAMSEQLEKCDLIDTPGISDPNIPTDSWINTIGYANSVLWCTHAGQAWRESERSQWEALPERLRENSLLLVTRADKIVSREDLDKINRRLQRETSGLFSAHRFISLTLALRARQGGNQNNLWVRSGGEAFMKSLEVIISRIEEKRKKELQRYRSSGPALGAVRDNVSILRPTRIRPNSPDRHKARLDAADAASLRSSALGTAAEAGEETTVGQGVDEVLTEVKAPGIIEKTEEVLAAPEADAQDLKDTQVDAVAGVDEPKAAEPEVTAPETAEPEHVEEFATKETVSEGVAQQAEMGEAQPEAAGEDLIAKEAHLEQEVTLGEPAGHQDDAEVLADAPAEADEQVDKIADNTDNDDATILAALSEQSEDLETDVEEDAHSFMEQLQNIGDMQSDDTILDSEANAEVQEKEVEAEDILNVVSKIAAVSEHEPETTVSEEIKPQKSEGDYERSQSPSEVWKEILASQKIETMPEMIEAISQLLERLDRKHFGSEAA